MNGDYDSETLREMCVAELPNDPWYIVLFGGEIYDDDEDGAKRHGLLIKDSLKKQKVEQERLIAQRKVQFDHHVKKMKRTSSPTTYVEVAALSAILKRL
jgi:hypothetical protein